MLRTIKVAFIFFVLCPIDCVFIICIVFYTSYLTVNDIFMYFYRDVQYVTMIGHAHVWLGLRYFLCPTKSYFDLYGFKCYIFCGLLS